LQTFRKYRDVASWCAISSGVALGALGNYFVINLNGKMPVLIYMYSVLCAIIAPLVMGALFPLGEQIFESSVIRLHRWKSVALKRKIFQSKAFLAIKPMGSSIGSFLVFKKGCTGGVFEQLMNYTINAILSF